MNRLYIFLFLFVLSAFFVKANPESQRPTTDANIFGHVVDLETGEHLPFVNIMIKDTRIGTITDASGHYILTNLPEGNHILLAQSLGFERAEVEFSAMKNKTQEVDIKLRRVGINLEEIVLTASPTASGFRYQPDAVFMGEKLQRRGEASFGEMLNGQPGVAMRSFGSAPSRPVIRGMDGDRILVLENGERMGDIAQTSADHAISLDPLVANRLEVVRGPASLLYGTSALGGVINLMTSDIPDDADAGFNGVLSGQTASMNNMGAGFGRITYSTGEQAFNARMAYRESGNISTPDGVLPQTSMQNLDGSVGWGVQRDNLIGGLSFSFFDQTFEVPEDVGDEDETIEIRAQRMAFQGRFNRNFKGNFFDRAQLRFNAAHFFQQEVEVEFDENGNIEDEEVELEYDQYSFSSTLTLQHKPYGIVDRGALGFNFMAQSLDVVGDEAYTPGEQRVSLAMFTFQEVPLTNVTRLQFGVRLDFQNSQALPNVMFPAIDKSRNALNYSGSLGLNVRPTEGMEIGGQLARSHRNPMVEELFADGPHLGAGVYERGSTNLKDEIGHGFDLFFRWKKPMFDFEVAGFVNDFFNYIVFQPTGEVHEASGYDIFEYVEGRARLFGGEVSGALELFPSLMLNSGIDVVYGRRILEDDSNEDLPFIPPFRFNSALEYNLGNAWLGTDFKAVTTQSRVAPGEDTTEGYFLLGFQAGYRLDFNGRHVFVLRVDNALDTKYRDHLSRIEDRNFVMPGRNVNLSYRWFF